MFQVQKKNYSIDELQNFEKENKVDRPRVNYEIKVPKVRVIGSNGENLGVINPHEAIKKAQEVLLDLVEINPNENPPICKIMDLGKYIYEKNKKLKGNSHNKPETRELRLSPTIAQHDLELKATKAKEFILEGSKVILTFKLKGRETKHPELVKEVMDRFNVLSSSFGSLEQKGDVYILSPKKG